MSDRLSREQVSADQTWNLDHIYPDAQHWLADSERLDQDVQALNAFKGRLGAGSAMVLACLQAHDTMMVRLHHLQRYAYFSLAADGNNPQHQAMSTRGEALAARVGSARSFLKTEVASLPDGTVEHYLAEEPGLVPFKPLLDELLQMRGHLLSYETEVVLSALGPTFKAPETIWQLATAVDLSCPPIQDASGTSQAVSIASYVSGHAQSTDRTVRRAAFESLTVGLHQHSATLATALATHIQQNVTLARHRGYDSATEMILARQRVPVAVYDQVLEVVHDEMAPHVRRLMRLRANVLGLATLERYDLEAPLDPGYTPATTFEETAGLIQEALKPLGPQYETLIGAAFRDRWIDLADNQGKRSGAFCWPVYNVHPYVFITWRDTLRSAFTLAHELGHGAHYQFSLLNNRFSTVSQEGLTFIVEAPSTANELLLSMHLLDSATDPRLRRWLIVQSLSTFTHNMVTHMLEAHFERRLYTLAEAGEPLTLGTIKQVQGDVFSRFYAGTVAVDEGARLYWAQQPHFYMNLFPYSYSAGLACGFAAVTAMRSEGQPAIDRWLRMLTLGTTIPPLELAHAAGVDMGSPDALRAAATYFGTLVHELELAFEA